MKAIKAITSFIDTINHWVGTISSYSLVPLMIVIVVEVITRKLNHPTLWGYETILFIYGFLIMMVAGFGLLNNVLVSVDLFSSKLSEYNQKILSLVTYIIFFLPFMTGILPDCWETFYKDFVAKNVSMTAWGPVMWPIKLVIPVSMFLLWIQGISEILKTIVYLIENKGNRKQKKVEEGETE